MIVKILAKHRFHVYFKIYVIGPSYIKDKHVEELRINTVSIHNTNSRLSIKSSKRETRNHSKLNIQERTVFPVGVTNDYEEMEVVILSGQLIPTQRLAYYALTNVRTENLRIEVIWGPHRLKDKQA